MGQAPGQDRTAGAARDHASWGLVTEPLAGDGPPLVVMVRFADARGVAGRRTRAGLASLLEAVRRHQARSPAWHALDH